jgi:hypothetical protein
MRRVSVTSAQSVLWFMMEEMSCTDGVSTVELETTDSAWPSTWRLDEDLKLG